jgi:DNA-binding MarR family transcriptional regulator
MNNDEIKNMVADISYVVHALSREAFAKIDEYLKEYDLVRSHAAILTALKKNDEMTMGDLGNEVHVTKSNVTLLIDKLEKLGYVERFPSKSDRRVSLIKLSPEGNHFLETHQERLYDYFSDSFSSMSSQDLAEFKSSIFALKNILSKMNKE